MAMQGLRCLVRHGLVTQQLLADFTEIFRDNNYSGSKVRYSHGFAVLPALLPNLQHLYLKCIKAFMEAEHDKFTLQYLTGLQTLSLDVPSNGRWTRLMLSGRLTALLSLSLTMSHMDVKPFLLAPSMRRLTLLTDLSLCRFCSFRRQLEYVLDNLADVLSYFSLLQSLSLDDMMDYIPQELSQLHLLHSLTVEGLRLDFKWHTSLCSYCKLTKLTLTRGGFFCGDDWLENCQALASLPRLSSILLTDLGEVAVAEWAFSTLLTSLGIIVCTLLTIPDALVILTSVQSLCLGNSYMTELPSGPHLQHLTELDLSNANVKELQPSLSMAVLL